ncbi:MAG TPA: glutamine amidotransferase [Ktedonobacteraceae bacterium]|nr:glutamine amidotransferase [Ktedonobacteraceae bacterium]
MLTFEQPLLLLLIIPVGSLVFLTWRRMSLPFPKSQRMLILICRFALFALIISALAGPALAQPISKQAVVFVGDISASTAPQQVFIQQWISNAIRQKRPDDQVGIVAVGRNALVEQSVSTTPDFSQFETTPDTNYTDLAAGLRLAAAILPNDSERRIVLLSDGQQNLEDALPEAQLLRQQGIRVDVVPLPAFISAEARIDGLDAPNSLRVNEHFVLHARLYSTTAQPVTLSLYLDRTLLLQRKENLAIGEQDVTFNLSAPAPGFHSYRLTMDAAQDTISQNNEASAFVNVQGPPQVLVVEGKPGAGHNIVAALQATHVDVTVGTPADVPTTLDGLASYDAVVLADVPALDLGTARMQVIQSFVRDLGRGLVVGGGENSYGVGDYAGTPLEETLPLKMDIPQHKDNPAIAVVLIVESLESQSEVNISKEAAKGVVSLLTPNDLIAVSAAFGNLDIPMQHVTNKSAIDAAIDALNPNDPQSYMPDLVTAEKALLNTNAKIKHVILLGDGDATDSYSAQVLKMASEHISISVVGTNIDAIQDLNMMQQIATLGKGRFYQADDPNAIPQILLNETKQAAKRAIVQESFVPAIVGTHPILTGLSALPELNGYVATTPKPTAQLVLISHLDDPVLAVWQYGLGRVAAWTSDALGLWTASWLSWKDAARWWANLVTWTLPTPDSQLLVSGQISNGNGHIIVSLPAVTLSASQSIGQQQAQVNIITPNLSRVTLNLQPTAPGRFEGDFPTDQVGVYLLRATWQAHGGNGANSSQLSTTTGLVVPYSPEYSTSGTDLNFLSQLAHAGGGSVLTADNYAAAFTPNLPPVYAALSITFWLFAIAALLLPIDIALRRLSSVEFLVAGYHWLISPGKSRKAAQSEDNLLLGNIRAHREQRKTRASVVKTQDSPAQKTPVATLARQESTPVKKEQERSTTSRLLEEKRKREQAKTRRE